MPRSRPLKPWHWRQKRRISPRRRRQKRWLRWPKHTATCLRSSADPKAYFSIWCSKTVPTKSSPMQMQRQSTDSNRKSRFGTRGTTLALQVMVREQSGVSCRASLRFSQQSTSRQESHPLAGWRRWAPARRLRRGRQMGNMSMAKSTAIEGAPIGGLLNVLLQFNTQAVAWCIGSCWLNKSESWRR